MDKFFEWFGRHRKTIGYVVGGANIGSGIVQIVVLASVVYIKFL